MTDPRNARASAPDARFGGYTFHSLTAGEHNREAIEACRRAILSPGSSSPLVIVGETGLGKTHLLRAAAHAARELYGDGELLYVGYEDLLEQLAAALRREALGDLRVRFARTRLLLVDDAHLLATRPDILDECVHLVRAPLQAIVTSHLPTSAYKHPRLRSWLGDGRTVGLSAPNLAARREIVRRHLVADLKGPVDLEACEYVAEARPGSIRQLEGAAMKVSAYSLLARSGATHRGRPITVNLAREALRGERRPRGPHGS